MEVIMSTTYTMNNNYRKASRFLASFPKHTAHFSFKL